MRVGVRERIEELGQRVIRDCLPDQHREFYAQLPFLLLGTLDKRDRPWASVLAGRPGFVRSPDPYTLKIGVRPIYGDPLNENIVAGADVGILGIEFHSRRRNRINGKIVSVSDSGFEVRVEQAFGNCPQYIQARDFELDPGVEILGEEREVARLSRLSDSERAIIIKADNFYIASRFSEGRGSVSEGVDVSHRGGKPSFVRIEGDQTLTFPDFLGNFHFNTLGNILMNPRAGLLFIDFDNHDLLYMTGTAEIIWDSEEVRAFTGAERLIRFTMENAIHVFDAFPIRWQFREYSPTLDQTGSWEQVAVTLAARAAGNVYRDYRVARVAKESSTITSFYLEPEDGDPIPCHKAGQFLPLELHPPGVDEPVLRTYTISESPNGSYYRLSIKREPAAKPGLPPGIASNYFHDHVTPGAKLRALSPRGKFTLDTSSTRPVALISAGVGITPMIAMVHQLVRDSIKCGCKRTIWFIHGARDGAEHAFGAHLRRLANQCETLRVHIRYSRPRESDQMGGDYDSEGRVDIELLKSLLPFDDHDFYLCGPLPFMQAIYSGFKSLNIADDHIHYEFFGEGALLHGKEPAGFAASKGLPVDIGPVNVVFARSDIRTIWNPSKGTLLDLAEAQGLHPNYSCRSGICQTCTTRLVSGEVEYLEPPMVPPRQGEVLICCSYPRPQADSKAAGEGIVLDI